MRNDRTICGCVFSLVISLGSSALCAQAANAAEPPPLPAITELSVFPAKLDLSGIRDSRRVLVGGKTADGQSIDLTGAAQLAVEGDAVALENGYVTPKKEGAA